MSLDRAYLEAAARWYVELRCEETDETLHEAHRQWLNANPGHVLAWERLTRLQESFDSVGPGVARPILSSARLKRREALKVLSLLLAAGGTAMCWRQIAAPFAGPDFQTRIGERQARQLEDGTHLYLNTATAIALRYSPQVREVQLLRGEILVETAQDIQARPFVVHTPQGSIRALGTRFVVRNQSELTRVSVIEHAVEVRTASTLSPVRVQAGQQLLFSGNQTGLVQPADRQSDAWTRGMLIVDDWRLEDMIIELQRYCPGYLGCAPGAANLRISGAFHLGDINAVLENLPFTLPVRIRRITPYWARVEPA